MSKSRKDGKRGGGHRNTQGTEVWSSRYKKVDYTSKSSHKRKGVGYKELTNRHERRATKQHLRVRQSG